MSELGNRLQCGELNPEQPTSAGPVICSFPKDPGEMLVPRTLNPLLPRSLGSPQKPASPSKGAGAEQHVPNSPAANSSKIFPSASPSTGGLNDKAKSCVTRGETEAKS